MKDIAEIEARFEEIVKLFKQYLETTPKAMEYMRTLYGTPELSDAFRILGLPSAECEVA